MQCVSVVCDRDVQDVNCAFRKSIFQRGEKITERERGVKQICGIEQRGQRQSTALAEESIPGIAPYGIYGRTPLLVESAIAPKDCAKAPLSCLPRVSFIRGIDITCLLLSFSVSARHYLLTVLKESMLELTSVR